MEAKTYDLQIFLGRIPGTQPTHYEGIPSLIVAEGPLGTARSLRQSSTESREENDLPLYIAVANSDVVEVVRFPFSPESIVRMIHSLTSNRARLQECVAFGAQLFDFLFQRSVRDLFRRFEDKGGSLRITLATAVPELAYIPWELLCDTRPGELPQFLSYQQDIHLIRSLRLFNRTEFVPITLGEPEQLRILLVTASPRGETPIDILREEQMLRFVLEEMPSLETVHLEVLHDATVQRLRDILLSFRPHIVHVACHGGYNQEEDLGFIALASADDLSPLDRVNSYRFATLIQEPDSVQLVFVNTCYGAFQGTSSAFSGIAQCLHAIGVSAVVALQFLLQDKTAHAIVLNFYRYLLRVGDSVEDSVTKVRRHLFMNGYIFPESFGLTMYQANATLAWQAGIPTERTASGSAVEFNKFTEMFDEKIQKLLLDKVSSEFDRVTLLMKDLPTLSNQELLKAMILFENQNLLAIRVLHQAYKARAPLAFFLQGLDLAKKVAHARYEGHPVSTAFLLRTKADTEVYQTQYNVHIGTPLAIDLFSASIKEVLVHAIKVNGQDKTFLITTTDDTETVTWSIQTLESSAIHLGGENLNVDPRWTLVAHNTHDAGCAFIVPGDPSPRLKILIGGWQVAEYSSGTWCHANLQDVRDGFVKLARKTSLDEDLLLSIMQKCLAASERRRGFSLIIQRQTAILPRCHPGYQDVSTQPDSFGLRSRIISQIPPTEYLDNVAGDNAVILSSDGYTLAYQAALAAHESTQVVPIPGSGSRHLYAQKITKETDAVAIVVSEDGPITIFLEGNIEQRYFF